MGIDMYVFIEVKYERAGEWELFAPFLNSRKDHLLFNVLRGEDGECNYPSELKPRGLPKDVSFRVNRKYDLAGPDHYSTSWMSFQDLELAYGRYEKRRKEENGKRNFELEGMMGLMERLDKLQIETRLVYWFSY
ncbi:hypothetical protein KAX97_10760 [candidate division WOR-3 bacterium]|nr:hypothetical protein [candidate division WOR-3 bacterium]